LLAIEPGIQGQAGDPAVEGPVAVGGLGDRLDRLGLERQPLAASVLENIAPA
jgi:hypothetical protein